MTIQQPTENTAFNSPDHSLSHRVFANDDAAPVQSVVVDSGGIVTFSAPHMQQVDLTDQTIANATLAQVITFNTDSHHFGITRTSSSRFTIVKTGSYLICFSGIVTGVLNKTIDVWLRVNGTDVANSNTTYTFKSNGGTAVIAFSFIEHFTAGQYFEFWTSGSDTGNKWDYTASGANPTRPAVPSIIMTCNFVGTD